MGMAAIKVTGEAQALKELAKVLSLDLGAIDISGETA